MINPNPSSTVDALAAPRADTPAATRKADPLVRAGSPDPALAAPRADSPAEARKADPLVRAGSPDPASVAGDCPRVRGQVRVRGVRGSGDSLTRVRSGGSGDRSGDRSGDSLVRGQPDPPHQPSS